MVMKSASHIVSLTFDDALEVHLDRVVPLLGQQGFKGTFFVPVGAESFCRRLGAWRSVAAAGHELGNHTILHPAVRGKDFVNEGNAIERYTLDRMRMELEAGNRILAGIDGCHKRTFAYPCCNTVLGRPGVVKRILRWRGLDRTRLMSALARYPWLDAGSTEVSYETLAGELFAAARVGGERFCTGEGYPPRRSAVPCVALDGKTREDLEGVLDDFIKHDPGWLVFMGHGVGAGHRLTCEWGVLEWLIGNLSSRSIEVRTLVDAARIIYGD